jgi:predicted RNase H-like nuclease (RuvC/YqgF family)
MAVDSFPPDPHTPSQDVARLSHLLEATQAEVVAQRSEFVQAVSAWERTSAALTREIAEKQQTIASYERELRSLRRELEAIRQSSSWRVTAPLRYAVTLLKYLRPQKSKSRRGELASSSYLQTTAQELLAGRPVASEVRQAQHSTSMAEVSPPETASAMAKLVVIDQLNTSDEPESVQRIYQQFTRARKQALDKQLGS